MTATAELSRQDAKDAKRQLPDGWKWVKLGEVCEFIRGVSFDMSEIRSSPASGYLPILRAGNIANRLDLVNDLVWVLEANVSPEPLLSRLKTQ
jgi:type I restriction enzyme S subunit